MSENRVKMASEGEGDQGSFKDQILELGIVLLKDFIFKWIQRHINSFTMTREQLGAAELHEPRQQKVSQCLQLISDELDGNAELNSIIDDPTLTPSLKVFGKVAYEIFKDGKFNWGRVAALFYFTCKLIIKAYETKALEMVKNIINWAIDYLRENVINWITEQGGWEGIYSYYGTPTWQTVGVLLAGLLTAVAVVRKM